MIANTLIVIAGRLTARPHDARGPSALSVAAAYCVGEPESRGRSGPGALSVAAAYLPP
jgi:hypothetical protein